MSIDSAVNITVIVSLSANNPGSSWPQEVSYTLGADEAEEYLSELAVACGEGRAFGWMMTQIAECEYDAGEWRMYDFMGEKLTDIVADDEGHEKVVSAAVSAASNSAADVTP
jgi:hypothetical protein